MKKIFLTSFLLLFPALLTANADVYIWMGWNDDCDAEYLHKAFSKFKTHGVKGVCFNAGFDTDRIKLAASVAKQSGLEYHAWIPCMLQSDCPHEWYAVNRLGESADEKPAYVPYYKSLDPNNADVQRFLVDKYAEVAKISDVDYIQLDYIRYVDVILAKGLWKKYGLVMNEEYPPADYCYCDYCTSDFKQKTGIDIKSVSDPSKCKAWLAYRCNVVTSLVNMISEAVHREGKKISADVFPYPKDYAIPMVRQEWDKWDVDAFFPMNYNDFYLEPAKWVGKVTRKEVKLLKGKAPLYSGLFVCEDWRNKSNIADPEGWGLSPEELKTAVRGAFKAGASGICLFSASSMTDEHWAALDEVLAQP